MYRVLIITLLILPFTLTSGQEYRAPRTEHGMPDLQGVWNFNDTTPFARPERYGDREFLTDEEFRNRLGAQEQSEQRRDQRESTVADRILEQPTDDTGAYNYFWSYYDETYPNRRTSMIVSPSDGQVPPLVDGTSVQRSPPGSNPCADGLNRDDRPVRIAWAGISCDRPEDFALMTRCILFPQSGPPHIKANSYNNNLQIVQTRDHVLIYAEMGNDPRIIPLDGRPHADPKLISWTGNSRGHWEGATLVVVTKNFRPELASLYQRTTSYGSAEGSTVTERFTRVGDQALDYEFTIDDPQTFAEPLTARTNLSGMDQPIYEFACHEGNYAIVNMMRAARIADVEDQR